MDLMALRAIFNERQSSARLLDLIPPQKAAELLPILKVHFPEYIQFESPENLFPLKVETDSDHRPYISCALNRFNGSSRSPWSNLYFPFLDGEVPLLSDNLRNLEVLANAALSHYVKLYYTSALLSVYCLARKHGFMMSVLIKSPSVEIAHLIFITEKLVLRQADYLQSAAYLVHFDKDDLTQSADSEHLSLGFFHKQENQEEALLSSNATESHVANIGRMIELMDASVFAKIRTVYPAHMHLLVDSLRLSQTAAVIKDNREDSFSFSLAEALANTTIKIDS
uniref:F-actin-capping protein subunit beta n=1 Tax=Schistocephalus solidus TaxID=70667 RepID=A0A0X3PWP8_SCHSO